MTEAVIKVKNLSKRYRIGLQVKNNDTLIESTFPENFSKQPVQTVVPNVFARRTDAWKNIWPFQFFSKNPHTYQHEKNKIIEII